MILWTLKFSVKNSGKKSMEFLLKKYLFIVSCSNLLTPKFDKVLNN